MFTADRSPAEGKSSFKEKAQAFYRKHTLETVVAFYSLLGMPISMGISYYIETSENKIAAQNVLLAKDEICAKKDALLASFDLIQKLDERSSSPSRSLIKAEEYARNNCPAPANQR